MKSFLFFLVITAILFISAAFQTRRLGASSKFLSMARSRAGVNIALPAEEQDTFVPGKDIPQEVANLQSIYDMILVERLHEPEKTTGGLFLPKTEGRDQKHLGVVLSMPTYGLESENGLLNPIEAIAPFAVGDTVFIRDPWGIGPKDIQVGPRCFSFHKAMHITGVVKKAASSEDSSASATPATKTAPTTSEKSDKKFYF